MEKMSQLSFSVTMPYITAMKLSGDLAPLELMMKGLKARALDMEIIGEVLISEINQVK
jgi:hypothetical protein